MGCPGSWRTNLARAVTVTSLVCLLTVVGIIEGGGRRNMSSSTEASMRKRMEAEDEEAIVAKHAAAGLDLNYMNNRRVPNGPDPIHNRRAGSSGRSPGKA